MSHSLSINLLLEEKAPLYSQSSHVSTQGVPRGGGVQPWVYVELSRKPEKCPHAQDLLPVNSVRIWEVCPGHQ